MRRGASLAGQPDEAIWWRAPDHLARACPDRNRWQTVSLRQVSAVARCPRNFAVARHDSSSQGA